MGMLNFDDTEVKAELLKTIKAEDNFYSINEHLPKPNYAFNHQNR